MYSLFVPAPLCCLAAMLLALVGLALASKPGLLIGRPPPHHPPHNTRSLSFSSFPPTQHSLLHLCPPDNSSQPGQHGRGCSTRKVRGCARVKAMLQPLSWCDCPWWFSRSFACLPPPLRRTEAACGSHALPCVMPAPSPAVVCPPSAMPVVALPIIMTPPPTTSNITALLLLPSASKARGGRRLVFLHHLEAWASFLWPRACVMDSNLLREA